MFNNLEVAMDKQLLFPKLFLLLVCFSQLFLSNFAFLKSQERSSCGWAITRFDYCRDAETGRALVSNSLNSLIWNGTTWVPAINVNCNTADSIWGRGLGTSPPYPWRNLYDNGACWISKNSGGTVSAERDTLWVRHRLILPNNLPCYRLSVEFFVDDSLIIFKNSTGIFPPNSSMIVGRDGGFNTLKTISFDVPSGLVILDFCLISTRRNYIGLIYGIKCDTCYSDCGWPILRDDYCHDICTGLNLVSNGEYGNIQIWNGSNWVPALNVPTTISRPRWGPPNYPFDNLLYNGACWISKNSSGSVNTNPEILFIRHKFCLPNNCKFYKLTVDFNVDDSLEIFYNYPFNSSPGSGILVGRGNGFGQELKSVSFIVMSGQVCLDLKVISNTEPFIGLIYGIKCEEVRICDSIMITTNSPPRPIPNQRCCFEFNIYNPFTTPIPMNIVRFLLTNGASCVYATGPSSWTLYSTLPSSFVQFGDVSLQPGSNIFTLCFDRNPRLVLYLLWLSYDPLRQHWDTCDCKYPFNLYCFKDCCDSFNLVYKTDVQQLNYNTLLLTFCPTNILPEPDLYRFSAYLAFARRDYHLPHTIFDIINVQSQYGSTYIWSSVQPPGTPPNTMIGVKPYDLSSGLPGVYGGHYEQPNFSRELIWGDVDLRNITDFGRINGHCFKTWIRITPAPWTFPPHPTIYKFAIRYLFTDTTCCTCDTLVRYSIRVYPRWWDPFDDFIILDSEHNGGLTIYNHRPIDVNDSNFIKLGFDFYLDTSGISIVRIKSLKDGMTYIPDTTGRCKVSIKLLPGDTAKFIITFNNPKNIQKFRCKVIEYYLVNGDTIPLEREVRAIYKVKGDEISLYNAGNPKDVKVIALLLRNNNLRQEGISHILIKPKNKEKIIAIGSDAINLKSQLGIFNLMDSPIPEEIVILPETFKDAIISELKPKSEIKPIYLAYINPVNQPGEFIFETYNSEYELISDDEFIVPVSGVKEDNANEVVSNLIVSPNPAKDNISISFFVKDFAKRVTIRIFDVTGKLIDTILENSEAFLGTNVILYSTSNLSSGQYFIKLTCEDNELVEDLVIIK